MSAKMAFRCRLFRPWDAAAEAAAAKSSATVSDTTTSMSASKPSFTSASSAVHPHHPNFYPLNSYHDVHSSNAYASSAYVAAAAAAAAAFDANAALMACDPMTTQSLLNSGVFPPDPVFLEAASAAMSRAWKLPPKKQRPKRFQCPHCQVSFSNNGQLKGHIRIHTGKLTKRAVETVP